MENIMRKLAKTFVRTGTFRVIDICSKPKVSSGIRYGIRVEDDGHIGVYVGTNDTIGWDEIHLNKITVPVEDQS
jgi:hypothetical protein